jgi:hypothetical protein
MWISWTVLTTKKEISSRKKHSENVGRNLINCQLSIYVHLPEIYLNKDFNWRTQTIYDLFLNGDK